MILSFLLLLFLIGNGASGFHASNGAVTRHFENTYMNNNREFSRIATFHTDATIIRRNQGSYRSPEVTQRRASETAFSFTDVLSPSPKSLREICDRAQERYPGLGLAVSQVEAIQRALSKVVAKSWWIWPMVLAVIPVYCAVFKGTYASMPDWWPVVRMDMIRQSKDAALVIGGFLLSNIAYFVSGGFLVQKFPFKTAKNGLVPIQPTKFTNLGLWILTAGTVSTIFHSVQALGSHAVAESLCYVDHGIAISACFYFLKTCGFPSKKVLTLGIAALATLVVSYPCYAFLHSTWHFLSAAVATKWAIEGYDRMQ